MRVIWSRRSGLSLIELIVAFTILLILSSMALPLAGIRVQRQKERLLQARLDEMRKAIDRHKDMADAGKLGTIDPDSHGYPESLEALVEGTDVSGQGMGGGMPGMPGMPGMGTPRGAGGSNFGNQSSSGFGGGSRGGSGFGGGSAFGGSGTGRGGSFGMNSGGGMGSGMGGGMGSGSRRGMGNRGGTGSDDENASKIRFLRRIPVDPITGFADWGMRSVQDEPESMSWGGRNVFDVYSTSMDMALDGTFYRDW